MKTLTSYERVKTSLEHKEPDKVPFDLGAAAVTGINNKALRSLRRYLGLSEAVTVKDKITQIANIEDDLIDILKIDTQGTEYQVVEGAKETISQDNIKLIYLEELKLALKLVL